MLVFRKKQYIEALTECNKAVHAKLKEISKPDYYLLMMVKLQDEELKLAKKCRSFASEWDGKPREELIKAGLNIKKEWCVEE